MGQKTYSASELARAIGVDRGTVTKWAADGCPAEKKDEGAKRVTWRFELPQVVAWLREQAKLEGSGGLGRSSFAEIERAKAAVDLELAELKLAELRGVMLRIDDVIKIVGADYDALRKSLNSAPARLGPDLWARVAGGMSEGEFVDAISQAFNDVLADLSGERELARRPGAARIEHGTDRAPGAAKPNPKRAKRKTPTTAEADAQRVGRSKPKAQRRGKRGARPVGDGSG